MESYSRDRISTDTRAFYAVLGTIMLAGAIVLVGLGIWCLVEAVANSNVDATAFSPVPFLAFFVFIAGSQGFFLIRAALTGRATDDPVSDADV